MNIINLAAIGWAQSPGVLAAAADGASSNIGQVITALLGIVGIATGGYGIYRTNRVDNRAARSTDVNDALGVIKASNVIVKEDLDRARKHISEQDDVIAEQAAEIVKQAQRIIEQTQHINAIESKITRCEKLCSDMERRMNEMEKEQ